MRGSVNAGEFWLGDGVADTLPEPSPAEMAVIAEIAKTAGIAALPDRLLEALMPGPARTTTRAPSKC